MRKKKNLLLAAAVSAAFLFGGYSITYADTASLKEAALNGIYLGSDYCDLDGGNSDVATCYYLGKDSADNQYKVIAVRVENNDGLLNNGHGSKLINSTAGIKNASAVYVSETLTSDQLTTFGLNGWKSAYRDASNVGANLKKDDDKTAASTEEVSANQTAWGNALGSGKVEKGNDQLVKGGTVYEYEAPPSTDEDGEEAEYTYISSANTTGQNLANLDDQVSNNTGTIGNLQNGVGFTKEGDAYIKNLAKDSVGIAKGDRVTITPNTDADGKVTYTVSANNDGKIVSGNTDLVSGDTAYKAIKAETDARTAADQAMQDKINNYFKDNNVATDSALALKANTDASNVGINLKNADGGVASSAEQEKNKDAWGKALGGGQVDASSEQLVTGKTMHEELRPLDGTYVKQNQTTAENLSGLDKQVADNTSDISKIKSLSNLSDAGKDVIREISKDTVKVTAGNHMTVTTVKDEKTGSIAYKVSANADGKVEKGSDGLVSGDTVYQSLHGDNVEMGRNASALGTDSTAIGKNAAASGSSSVSIGTESKATGTGSVTIGNHSSANGQESIAIGENATARGKDSVAIGNNTIADEDNTVAIGNRRLTQVAEATADTDVVNLKQMKKAIQEGTSIKNISEANKADLKNIVKDTVKVADGDNTTVFSSVDDKGNITYKVHAKAEGKIEAGNHESVSGDTVKSALDTKANTDGSNVAAHAEEWSRALGTGEIKEGNTYLVTGDTVYKGLSQMIDDKALVKSDGNTLTIGARDNAFKVDIHNADGKGRVITGVTTDASDPTSAANVGYVNKTSEGLMRGMESMRHELKNEIYDSTAKAGAIASLHPQDYDPGDKFEFAAGFGHYHGSNATALGAFYHVNEDLMFNVGATVGVGSPLVTGGVSIKVGSGNSVYKTRGQLKDEIVSLKGENNDLRNEVKTLQKEMAEVRIMLGSIRNSIGTAQVPANQFKGNRELTRYEYAQILYNALQKGQKVDYEKMQEYGPELKRIQVAQASRKLNALKKKAAETQKVHK